MRARRWLPFALVVLPLLAFAACGDDDDAKSSGKPALAASGNDGSTSSPSRTSPGSIGACDPGSEGSRDDKPSGYLLVPEKLLAKVKADAAAETPAFKALKSNADRYSTDINFDASGPENQALMYLLTNDGRYASSSFAWAKKVMGGNLSADSYLGFGDMARRVALVLNWVKDGLTQEQKKELSDFLDASVNELWFQNKGSHWAISDDDFSFAGNNYRMGFIEGTAFAGYALDSIGDARGKRWIDLAMDKLERKRGVLEYMDTLQSGGDWLEGTNYGERSKQRLYRGLAAIASMGGKNLFVTNPVFANSIQYAVYQAQPGNRFMYPGGDLARSKDNELSPYDREYVQIGTYWLCDSPARRLGQYYLAKITPSYDDGKNSFDYGAARYLDVLYTIDIPLHDVTTLPLSYRATGTNWINARSGWDEHAISVSISGAPIFTQSHQHQDVGSFVIWKDKWLVVNPETFGGSGPFWPAEASQGLFVPDREQRLSDTPVPGLSHFSDDGAVVYAQVDASNLYRRRGANDDESLLNEHTREIVYLRPSTVFVFDRVDAKAGRGNYSLRLHLPSAPTNTGGVYSAKNGDAVVSVAPLLGGTVSVASDSDLGSASHRIVQAATGLVSRFLSVIEVGGDASSSSPELVGSAGSARGAIVRDHVVVFSDLPKGSTPPAPLTYSVPGTGSATHVLVNMSGSYDVSASRADGRTTVTIRSGSQVAANAEGVLVVSP